MSEPNPNTLGHFFESLTTSMVSIIITLVAFWTGFIKNLITRKEVEELLEQQRDLSQYAKDRQFIMERLDSSKETQIILSKALAKNTEVMTDLKVHIATLAKTLENLEARIEKSL